MKPKATFILVASIFGLLFCAIGTPVAAQTLTNSATYNPNFDIPDNSTVGVADTRQFASSILSISNIRLTLNITGTPDTSDAFNGDFYAYLTNGSGFAVLLNRVGRTATNDFGYSDSGFNVTFDDSGSATDIHTYLEMTDPAGAALSGVWMSDGRNVNPSLSLDTTPRTVLLTSFNGQNPNADWTLFVADLSPTGTGRLASWTLEVTGVAPEPSVALLLACGGMALGWSRRR